MFCPERRTGTKFIVFSPWHKASPLRRIGKGGLFGFLRPRRDVLGVFFLRPPYAAQPEAFRQQGGRDERAGNGIILNAQQERTERDEGADARCDLRCGGKSPLSGPGVQRQQDQQDTGAKCRKERRKIRIAERREIKIGVQLPERRCGRARKLQHRTIGQGLQNERERREKQKRQAFLHGRSS